MALYFQIIDYSTQHLKEQKTLLTSNMPMHYPYIIHISITSCQPYNMPMQIIVDQTENRGFKNLMAKNKILPKIIDNSSIMCQHGEMDRMCIICFLII